MQSNICFIIFCCAHEIVKIQWIISYFFFFIHAHARVWPYPSTTSPGSLGGKKGIHRARLVCKDRKWASITTRVRNIAWRSSGSIKCLWFELESNTRNETIDVTEWRRQISLNCLRREESRPIASHHNSSRRQGVTLLIMRDSRIQKNKKNNWKSQRVPSNDELSTRHHRLFTS